MIPTIMVFGSLSTCYDMMLLIVLLLFFICMRVIQISKANSIS